MEILRLFGTSNDDTCYEVTLVNDRVRVETRVGFVARERREEASRKDVEPRHKIDLGSFTGWWSPGDGLKVKDGWLMGWHTSHYGGGLYWFSKDGNHYKKVDDRYTRSLAETSKGVFAFQSSAFFGLNYSRFVKLEQEGSRWTVQLVTDLHDAPQEILPMKDRFIYVGPQYVSTMELDGRQRVILRSSRGMVAGGMYQRKNGEIWIGNSRSILCLVPESRGQFKHFWFRPTQPAKPE